MTAPSTAAGGIGQPAADKLIIVGRSDGRKWTTEEIQARWARDRTAMNTGDPIPENPNDVADQQIRKTLALWKVVTARGVAEALNWPRDAQYQLGFPDGFCLRECTPKAPGWSNPPLSWVPYLCVLVLVLGVVKNPSADERVFEGAARQYAMYGHMAGCADDFVYRAPCEFVPHVLWLLSDSSDHNVCPCKPCHRATGRQIPGSFVSRLEAEIEKLDAGGQGPKAADAKSGRKATGSKSTMTKKNKPAGTTDAVSKTTATTATNPPARSTKQPSTAKSSTASKPSQSQSSMTSVRQPGPTAVPVPPASRPAWNNEPTLFRRGEMVWCQQLAPSAGWRIGIIREVRPETSNHPTPYVVIGLGHSSIELPDMERQVQHLRPFLTFSVPAISSPLPRDRSFSHVDWAQILANPQFTREMVGLEASKLAALEVDGSWSTFNQLPAVPGQAKNISIYGGAFLGAEMIRVNDPIRHKDKSRETVLAVAEISVVENINPVPGQQRYELRFRGFEYEPIIVPEQGIIPDQPEGAIFKKDTAFRTLAAKAGGKKMKLAWQVCAF